MLAALLVVVAGPPNPAGADNTQLFVYQVAAPTETAAQRLFEYLQSRAVTERLVEAGALEGIQSGDTRGATLKPDWDAMLRDLDAATATVQRIFLR